MAQLTAVLARAEVWLLILLLGGFLALLAWRMRLRWWPAWMMRVLLVGLVALGLTASYLEAGSTALPQRQVMVVDQSDSLDETAKLQAMQQAEAWQAGQANRMVVVFGVAAQAVLTENKESPESEGDTEERIDGRASDLDSALGLAANLLRDSQGKVIVASDGLANKAQESISSLVRQGHTLDVIPLTARAAENDLAVGKLAAPTNLWAGTAFDLSVPVYGPTGSGGVQVRLWVNGRESAATAETIGENLYQFRVAGLPQGMVTLEARANWGIGPEDPFPTNNSAFTTLQVFAPPRVLFVSSAQDTSSVAFTQRLAQNGIQIDTIAPQDLPTGLSTLQDYRVIFLNNLLANQLGREQVTALQVFVSRMAGGLVFLGGRNSYTLGGYQGTQLEAMLPVKMEPPPRTERPPIVFQLVLDRSSSMEFGTSSDNVEPMMLAREAAQRAIETLHPEDYLGVLTFASDLNWDVPIRLLGDDQGLQQALDAVSRVEAEGSTQMHEAMQEAVTSMLQLPADVPPNRHILFLSDGQSTDGTDEGFEQLAQLAQDQGITISSIALGEDADAELLQRIAEKGKGRFYEVKNAKNLPRVLISESQAARSENVQRGETRLEAGEVDHPVLSGLDPQQFPLFNGYNALKSKAEEGAEDVLVSSSFQDPILSTWQYGLGRVTAWMGDTGAEWSGAWPASEAGAFWAQVIRYTLASPALGPAQVNVDVQANRLVIAASVATANGDPLNLTEATFSYAGADGQAQSYRLAQESAGLYQAEIPRPAEGAYRGVLTYENENGQRREVAAPFAVDPPEEWLPPDSTMGQNNLRAWASLGQGKITSMTEIMEAEAAQAEAEKRAAQDGLWSLLLALVLLWPFEIAIRRRWLPWI